MLGRKAALPVRGLVASLAAATVVVVGASPGANAALNASISGSTYSDSSVYYTSATWRYISNDLESQHLIGFVRINIDTAPKLSNNTTPDGLRWRISGGQSSETTTFLNQNSSLWTTIPDWVGVPGTGFRNKYARATTCPNCNHDFAGNMDY